MNSLEDLKRLAMSLPEVTEDVHFAKTSLKVRKKIFATYDHKIKRVCLKLSPVDQDVFAAIGRHYVFPVPGAWGRKGWTYFETVQLRNEVLRDAVITAYCTVAPAKLAEEVRGSDR